MNSEARIPIVVSASGHREVKEADVPVIKDAVIRELKRLQEEYSSSEIRLMTNLAIGADTICAQAALELCIPLIAALPLDIEDYRKDFAGQDLAIFNGLVDRAKEVFTVHEVEKRPADAARNFSYRQGGFYIVRHSQVLLALWEGNPATPGGCGVAEVVEYAVEQGNTVIQVCTPRTMGNPGEVSYLGSDESTLRITDEYNERAGALPKSERENIFPEPYDAANSLSVSAATQYRQLLKLLAVFGTGIAVCFLLYDELSFFGAIFACGLLLALIYLIRKYIFRKRLQKNFLEYRVLAELIRVQAYISYAGSPLDTSKLYTLSLKKQIPWVCKAVPVLYYGEASAPHDISDVWLRNQRDYHLHAGKKSGIKLKKQDAVSKAALSLSLLIYVLAIVFEIFVKNKMATGTASTIRTIIGLCLGSFSAAALFIGSYYGKQSVSRQNADNEKMAAFFESSLKKHELYGQTEEFLEDCAREEIIENANWFITMSENTPDFEIF